MWDWQLFPEISVNIFLPLAMKKTQNFYPDFKSVEIIHPKKVISAHCIIRELPAKTADLEIK